MPFIHLPKEKLKNLDTHDSHQLTSFTSVSENIYIYFREGGSKISRVNPWLTGAGYRENYRETKYRIKDRKIFEEEPETVMQNLSY